MEVAVLYSGGKDSTLALEHCLNKKWNIKYLISVKPTRTDCYLYHFSTVELTKELSKILNLKHILTTCDISDPKKEAQIVKDIISKNPVDALILGGIGLQETQIKTLRDSLFDLGVEVFASHTSLNHDELIMDMINRGYEIIITQVAAEGLTQDWLGKKLTKENFEELKKLSVKYGFHSGAEGGHYDTLVLDAPFFNKKLEILDYDKVIESKYSGFLRAKRIQIIEKKPVISSI